MMRLLFHLLAASFCWLLVSCGETREVERVVGYGPYASRNPYLAAERYLAADGHKVKSTTSSLEFNSEVGVLFSPASSMRSVGEAKRLLGWVKQGGHFVCFLERGEDFYTDVGERPNHNPETWERFESSDEDINLATEHLLSAVALEKVPEDADVDYQSDWSSADEDSDEDKAYRKDVKWGRALPNTDKLKVEIVEAERAFAFQAGGNFFIKPTAEKATGDWIDDGERHRLISRRHGAGRVTILSDARPFRNPYLKLADHAELLDYLAETHKEVVFSLGKTPGFLELLRKHAWRALWGLLLLVVLWLWKNLPRFGPLLGVTAGHSRNYAEQVSNTGKFLWRNKCDAALLEPLRAAVLKKAGVHGDEETDTVMEKLSDTSGLSKEVVTDAMTHSAVHDANSMVKISQTLQTILKSL